MDCVLEIIPKLVKPGFVCVDVGANIGETAKRMLDAGAAHVICVEPMPKWAAKLRENLNGLAYVVYEGAVGEKADCQKQWFALEDSANPGNGCLSDRGIGPVNVTTLDKLIDGIAVNFVKIDVEGMELSVLRGAQNTLAYVRPIVLYETRTEFECNGPVFKPIADMLRGFNYQIFNYIDGRMQQTDGLARSWDTIAIPI